MYVELVRVPETIETFFTAVVVAVTRKISNWSTTEPVADVFCVATSIDHTPVAYEPGTVPSKIQPTDCGLTPAVPVVALAAVLGKYGHVAAVVPFAMPVPVVAAAPGVSDIWATEALAETTVDAVDVRYSNCAAAIRAYGVGAGSGFPVTLQGVEGEIGLYARTYLICQVTGYV